jgi:hypothetical protein
MIEAGETHAFPLDHLVRELGDGHFCAALCVPERDLVLRLRGGSIAGAGRASAG